MRVRLPRSRTGRVALIALAVIACLVVGVALAARHAVTASLPLVDGTHPLPGLARAVRVERDGLGIPTIRGASRLDVARATGFVHAQDRFFEMDLARRIASGELSELVGDAALESDRAHRIHGLRAVCRDAFARAEPAEREMLQAYAEGVNAGLAALGARPPEYLLLTQEPAPWRPEDSLLVLGAMFDNDLQNTRRERELGAMYDVLPAALVDFLRPLGDEWDAPLVGGSMVPAPIPGPEVFTVMPSRQSVVPGPLSLAPTRNQEPGSSDFVGGSNAWAIAGSHTADGRPIVANDPHLLVSVPNIWYRLALEWRDASGVHRTAGVSLPGLPPVAIGSNGHVAWGFTVAFDDRSDYVVVELVDGRPEMYRTPTGLERLQHRTERIRVSGGGEVPFEIVSTIWGPIVGRDGHNRPLALQWQAHHPDALDLHFLRLEEATTLEQALDLANRSGLPSYNFIAADDRGSIGWTVTGRLPRRVGFDGRTPTSWADGTRRWDGWLALTDYPRIVNPPGGRIWSSNNRMVDRPVLDRLGLEGYVMGPRARQVRDDLTSLQKSTPAESLRVQLDDRAFFLDRWRLFLIDALRADARRAGFRGLVESPWSGRASADSVAFRLVHDFREELARLVVGPLVARCADADRSFAFRPDGIIEWWESALWRLVHERPAHLLNPAFATWDSVVAAAVDRTVASVTANRAALASATWGSTTRPIAHPLSRGVALLAPWLDMPYDPLPGDSNMPRVRLDFPFGMVSASMRMAVSPGREEGGLLHMPGGESGHPLSPHYRDMQAAWVAGKEVPFLPGRAEHTLTLTPR